MRRGLCLLLCLLLILPACGKEDTPSREEMAQPIEFYYRCKEDDLETQDAGIRSELRDLGTESLTAAQVLEQYLAGPVSGDLKSPFPSNLKLEGMKLEEGILTLDFNRRLRKLPGVQQTVAVACLVYTMIQLDDVDAVVIWSNGEPLSQAWNEPLTQEDFLLTDDTASSDMMTIKLYFSDFDGRYLVEENRSLMVTSVSELPNYVVRELLKGPEKNGLSVIPQGTSLLGLQVREGVCIVNLSSEFVENQPKNHRRARLAVFSLVNALTELPRVECVLFMCEGKLMEKYNVLDLSEPLYREEPALTRNTEDSTYDATMYLPCGDSSMLVAVPMMVHRTVGSSVAEDVLDALVGFDPANGYTNPIPDGTVVTELSVVGGLCKVSFNSAFALCDSDPEQAHLAVRSIVATLCQIEDVEEVQITIQNGTFQSMDLSETLTVRKTWITE